MASTAPRRKVQVTDRCAEHEVGLLYTPTNASWLNRIEAELTSLRSFTLDGSDHPLHTDQEHAIASYLRRHNRRCHPKRHFATNSRIRRSDHLPNVAWRGTGLGPAYLRKLGRWQAVDPLRFHWDRCRRVRSRVQVRPRHDSDRDAESSIHKTEPKAPYLAQKGARE